MTAQRRGRGRGRGQAGMTLVELMVAVAVVGIVASAMLGVLSTGAGLFKDAEQSADIQGNLRFGTDRMHRDLRNAGLDAPTNAPSDPNVRGGGDANWVGFRRNPSGLYAFANAARVSTGHGGANSGFPTESVTVLGNFSNSARHVVTSVDSSGVITLQNPALPSAENIAAAAFAEMYPLGAPVGLQTRNGMFLGNVVGSNYGGANGPTVTMIPAPAGASAPQGFSGNDATIAPLRFMRYSLQTDPADASKTDLIAEEVNSDGSSPAYARRQLIAENAVGLRFIFCKDTGFSFGAGLGGANIVCSAGGPVEPISTSPEQIRAVRVAIWLRAAQETNYPMPPWATAALMPEVGFNVTGGTERLARVRRLETSVELPNFLPRY